MYRQADRFQFLYRNNNRNTVSFDWFLLGNPTYGVNALVHKKKIECGYINQNTFNFVFVTTGICSGAFQSCFEHYSVSLFMLTHRHFQTMPFKCLSLPLYILISSLTSGVLFSTVLWTNFLHCSHNEPIKPSTTPTGSMIATNISFSNYGRLLIIYLCASKNSDRKIEKCKFEGFVHLWTNMSLVTWISLKTKLSQKATNSWLWDW